MVDNNSSAVRSDHSARKTIKRTDDQIFLTQIVYSEKQKAVLEDYFSCSKFITTNERKENANELSVYISNIHSSKDAFMHI